MYVCVYMCRVTGYVYIYALYIYMPYDRRCSCVPYDRVYMYTCVYVCVIMCPMTGYVYVCALSLGVHVYVYICAL